MPRTPLLIALLASAAFGATALTVDDERIVGELVAVDATPHISLSVDKKTRRLPGADLLSLQLRDDRPAPAAGQAVLVLRNGDQVRGSLSGGTKSTVEITSPAFGVLACPIAAVARLHVAASPDAPLPDPSANSDRLLFVNGDTVEGSVQAFGPKGVVFDSEHLGALEMGFDRVGAIQFARTAGTRPPEPEGVYVIAVTADGSRITGSLLRLQDGRIHMKTAVGPEASLDVAALLRLDFRGGRLAFLSDMTPSAVKETPCFDVVWAHRRDRSVDGNPLRLGGRVYSKGLGTHSRCELTFALEGKFKRFLAHVGVDEEVGGRGNALVQVLVDGKLAFENKTLRGSDAPLPVDVDVTGAKSLTLRTDFGAELDVCDHVDWAAARLVQ